MCVSQAQFTKYYHYKGMCVSETQFTKYYDYKRMCVSQRQFTKPIFRNIPLTFQGEFFKTNRFVIF